MPVHIYLSIYLSIYVCLYITDHSNLTGSLYIYIYIYIYKSVSIYQCLFISIYLSIYQWLRIVTSIYLSWSVHIYLFDNLHQQWRHSDINCLTWWSLILKRNMKKEIDKKKNRRDHISSTSRKDEVPTSKKNQIFRLFKLKNRIYSSFPFA